MPVRVWLLLMLLGGVLAGCSAGDSGLGLAAPGGPPPGPPSAARAFPKPDRTHEKNQAGILDLSIELVPGWNPVGFKMPQLSSLADNALVPGVAYYDGTTYQLESLSLAALNSGAGARRGFWIFATSSTTLSYSGDPDTTSAVSLHNGWNLISFTRADSMSGSSLVAQVAGQTVPLRTVVFKTFYELQPDGSTIPVDVSTGGTLQGGRAYWVYAVGNAVSLQWDPASAPAATSIRLVDVPSTVSADSASNTSLRFTVTAEILDQYGNRLDTSAAVSLTGTPANVTIGGTTNVSAVSGLATFSGLSVARPGPLNLVASTAGLPASPARTLTVTPGAPASLVFTQQPTTSTAGAALSPPVQTLFRDAQGNDLIPAPPVSVSLTCNSNQGTLTNSTASTDANGRATFANLRQNTAGTGYVLTASGSGLSADSDSFAIVPGTPSTLAFNPAPASPLTAGVATPCTIELRDAFGNRDPSASNTITLAIQAAPAAPGLPDLSTAEAGQQTFFSVNATAGACNFTVQPNNAGNWTLAASADGVSNNALCNFTVNAGAPAGVGFLQQPSLVQGNITMNPAVTVEVRDAFDNRANATNSVTLSMPANANGGTLEGTLTRAAVGGLATFNDLRVKKAGRGYQLSASASFGAPASSNTFDVGPQLVSQSTAGAGADRWCNNPRVSANGNVVVFATDASNLVSGDTNTFYDVFAHDCTTGTTTRVSVSSAPAQANGHSFGPSVSADGRYVTFYSDATNLIPNDTNGAMDCFVHDRQTNSTGRISVDFAGGQAAADSYGAVIAGDASCTAVYSTAALVSGDTNNRSDIFVRSLTNGAVTRVSRATDGSQANGDSYSPALSSNGQFVAFASDATNLVAGDTNGQRDVFVHDRQTGTTSRVSVNSSGVQGNSVASDVYISGSGRFVTFASASTNLVSGDTNGFVDVFLHDRNTGVTTRLSVDSSGGQGNQNADRPSISDDGRYAVFESFANNFVVNDTNNRTDIFLRDTVTGTTSKVSLNNQGDQGDGYTPQITPDARYIVLRSDLNYLPTSAGLGPIFLFNR